MSTDPVDSELGSEIGRKRPNQATIREGLLMIAYLAVLVLGITLLVTLELIGRL